MDIPIPLKPPDPIPIDPSPAVFSQDLPSTACSQNASLDSSRKRKGVSDIAPNKKTITDPESASPSVQTIYTHPDLTEENRKYTVNDKGPFIVHVSRVELDPSAGLTLRAVKFGQFLYQNNVQDISRDGIKNVGRNRISIEFKNAQAANSFVKLPALQHKYKAIIPTFSVTRMGLVRGVPVEWSMDDLVSSLDLPEGCGHVIKARRLNRKQFAPGSTTPQWIPTQSVVLTFQGQTLPQRVFCFHTSLPIETYNLPTIQCANCCRFGHIKSQCRSKPRCYRCAQSHSGEQCLISQDYATCLFCSGKHFSTDKKCPEQSRQRSIKITMSQENISFLEASASYPSVRRPYAEAAQVVYASPSAPSYSHPNPPIHSQSYKKTTFSNPRSKHPLPQGYDVRSHQALTATPVSASPNGCAFQPLQETPNDNFLETVLAMALNMISKYDDCIDCLPSNVSNIVSQLFQLFNKNNGPNNNPAVEL